MSSTTPDRRGGRPSPARLLRVLTGVDEDLLDRAPGDRARYTAMGGVVLGTATVATFSMLVALAEVLGGFHPAVLLPALIWGVFVLNLDRWLVSSASGTEWRRRVGVLVPRLLLAFFFGVVIAEPLVLRVFETAIVKDITNDREQERRDLASVLLRCNPDATAEQAVRQRAEADECDGHRVNLAEGHQAVNLELAGLLDQAKTLRDGIAADNAEQARRDTLASQECNGTPTATGETSGRRGRGAECLRREQEAQDFRESHPVKPRADRLAGMETRIGELEGTLGTARQDFQQRRDAEVTRQVDELIASQGAIGLLERFQALDELTSENAFLAGATWFIRIFFILIDCLPVVVKFLGGTTKYEHLVDIRTGSERRKFQAAVETDELRWVKDHECAQREIANAAAMRQSDSEAELRWHEAQADAELQRRVTFLATGQGFPFGPEPGDPEATLRFAARVPL